MVYLNKHNMRQLIFIEGSPLLNMFKKHRPIRATQTSSEKSPCKIPDQAQIKVKARWHANVGLRTASLRPLRAYARNRAPFMCPIKITHCSMLKCVSRSLLITQWSFNLETRQSRGRTRWGLSIEKSPLIQQLFSSSLWKQNRLPRQVLLIWKQEEG